MAQEFDVSRTLRRIGDPLIKWPLKVLSALGVTADQLTVLGLYLSLTACVVLITGQYRIAGVILLLAGLCDLFDGALARATETTNKSGAFLDSVIDRPADLAPVLTVTIMGAWHHHWWIIGSGSATLIVSHLIPYIKARGETLGCRVDLGVMPRAARLILLIIGLLTDSRGLTICLAVIAIGGAWTVKQRIRTVFKQLERQSP